VTTTSVNISDAVTRRIREIPPLPVVVQKLLAVMRDDRSSAQDLTQVLSADQALAGMVLKLVNSSFYGLSGNVSTVSRAVVILGHGAIRSLATGLGVVKVFSGPDGPQNQQEFWQHAIITAAGAEVLARRSGYPDPEEAFVAGLMHDIGYLLMSLAAPQELAAVMALGPDRDTDTEMRRLGIDHTRAGRKLLTKWKLPSQLIEAVRHHHNAAVVTGGDSPLTTIVALADALSPLYGITYETAPDHAVVFGAARVLDLNMVELCNILEEIEYRVAETLTFLQIAALDGIEIGVRKVDDGPRVAVVSGEPGIWKWTCGLLRHYGFDVVGMMDFFAAAPDAAAPRAVIVDPRNITPAQWPRILPVLQQTSAEILLLGGADGARLPDLGRPARPIPVVFGIDDILA
jgi:putative nucleotidyltransferase with HDIG domain